MAKKKEEKMEEDFLPLSVLDPEPEPEPEPVVEEEVKDSLPEEMMKQGKRLVSGPGGKEWYEDIK